MAGRVMVRQSFSSLSRWLASQRVTACREKPGCVASKVDANGSGSGAGRDGESCFLDEVGGDGAVDYAENLAHYLGPDGEQEA